MTTHFIFFACKVPWTEEQTEPRGTVHEATKSQKQTCQCCRDCWVVICAALRLIAQKRLALVVPWAVDHLVPLSMGILQARILEWIAISYSRGSSQPRD